MKILISKNNLLKYIFLMFLVGCGDKEDNTSEIEHIIKNKSKEKEPITKDDSLQPIDSIEEVNDEYIESNEYNCNDINEFLALDNKDENINMNKNLEVSEIIDEFTLIFEENSCQLKNDMNKVLECIKNCLKKYPDTKFSITSSSSPSENISISKERLSIVTTYFEEAGLSDRIFKTMNSGNQDNELKETKTVVITIVNKIK